MDINLGPFQFSSNFECGNLAKVIPVHPPGLSQFRTSTTTNVLNTSKKVSKSSVYHHSIPSNHIDYEFNLWTNPDCFGTEFENNNRTWFCFCIKGGEPGQRVHLSVMNLNKQFKLYSQGMQPVVQCVGDCLQNFKWERIKEKCTYRSEENSTVVSWIHSVPVENKATYYAFTYPYSYSDLQSYLQNLETNLHQSIYYTRELLIKSLDGFRLDLLTLSSHSGKEDEMEDRIPNLFPDKSTPRPFRFSNKKVVFVSARVHPGETPSSYVMNGFINFILSNDSLANKLREIFVFKIIPMLNPDGVVRGHYRTDQRGVNLNRVYINPSVQFHPTIYATKQIILYNHYGMNLNAFLKTDSSSLVRSETLSLDNIYSNPSLLDEDTCHSFSDAVRNKSENISHKDRSSLLDVDEPSASGWDCSSNISVESSCRANLFHHDISSEIHDDCSNLSCLNEGETGVTNMLGSLSPLQEFKVGSKNEMKSESCELSSGDHLYKSDNIFASIHNPYLAEKSSKRIGYAFSKELDYLSPNIIGMGPEGKEIIFDPSKSTANSDAPSNLFMYIDLHGHASKRGIFMYGNWFEDTELMVENMLFPKLLSLNCQNFDFGACNFSERNMYHRDRRDGMSKEGSGRVAVMRATGLLRSYTLECNYNTGRIVNVVHTSQQNKTSPPLLVPPKYTPTVFEDCGHKLGVSLYDLIDSEDILKKFSAHPINLNTLRSQIHNSLLSSSNSPRVQQHLSPINKVINLPKHTKLHDKSETSFDCASTSKSSSDYSNRQSIVSSPKLPRLHKARKDSWTLSADAENQEPSGKLPKSKATKTKKKDISCIGSSRLKGKAAKLKNCPSPKKRASPRQLFYNKEVVSGEGSCLTTSQAQSFNKLTSSKRNLTASVCLTPNISFKVSISDTPDAPKLIKKIERGRKQRSAKGINLTSKKLKTSMPLIETEPSDKEFIEKCPAQSSLSPRSPLASVCEPQTSQSSPGSVVGIITQSKGSHSAFAKTSKSTFCSAKRPTKHTVKPISKNLERLPIVPAGQRLKLLPKKLKKKGPIQGSTQPPLQWMIRDSIKVSDEIDPSNPKVKKRKKSARKSL